MAKHRKPGEGTYRRTYTARARTADGASRAVRIFRPVGETRAPAKAAIVAALKATLRPGESLDVATLRESWQGRQRLAEGGRATVYGPTRQEAADKLADAAKRAASGVTEDDARLTMGRFLTERWLPAIRPHVRPRTWEAYESHVRVHLKPSLGRVKLAKLTAAQVDAMLAAKLNDGLSPASVNRVRATLRRAMGQAVKWRLVTENVVKLTTAHKEDARPPTPLTAEQASTFLTTTAGDRLGALWALALGTGMRQGECLALQWADVNLDAGTVRVRHTLQRVQGGGHALAPPKSKRARRTVSLPTFVVTALRRHKAAQAAEKLAYSGRWPEGDYVFTSTVGTPLDARNVTKRLQRSLADAGLPRQRFHDLRHAAASLLLAHGADLRVVMEVLGHSSITLTANTYAHVGRAALKDAAAKLDMALGRL